MNMTTPRELLEVPVDQLSVSPINVRRDIGDVSELADSIREQGILEPLVGRPTSEDRYEIIIGSRRLTAAQQIGLSTVPMIVQDISDADAIVRSLVENLQRGDLSLEERVEAYKRLQEIEPTRFGNTRGLARATGRTNPSIVRDFDGYEAIQRLRPRGIEVKPNAPPASDARRTGRAIPETHATMLEQAIASVRSRLPEDRKETAYEDLARAIAPLEQDRAKRVLDYFKMYPEREVSDITAMALATVQRDVTVSAETARRLEEIAAEGGQRDWGEAIARLVDTSGTPEVAEPPLSESPETAMAPRVAEPPLSESARTPMAPEVAKPVSEELGESIPFPALQPDEQSADEAPRRLRYRRLELPEEPIAEQLKNRVLWNIEHSVTADFYTVGYAGRDIDQFLDILEAAGVRTVIDVRHTPISPHKPSFSRENLNGALDQREIKYIHRGDLGVPRNVRERAEQRGSRTEIWSWYKANVMEIWKGRRLKALMDDQEQSIAFLCLELDPSACHRHLLFLALKEAGLRGFDL